MYLSHCEITACQGGISSTHNSHFVTTAKYIYRLIVLLHSCMARTSYSVITSVHHITMSRYTSSVTPISMSPSQRPCSLCRVNMWQSADALQRAGDHAWRVVIKVIWSHIYTLLPAPTIHLSMSYPEQQHPNINFGKYRKYSSTPGFRMGTTTAAWCSHSSILPSPHLGKDRMQLATMVNRQIDLVLVEAADSRNPAGLQHMNTTRLPLSCFAFTLSLATTSIDEKVRWLPPYIWSESDNLTKLS